MGQIFDSAKTLTFFSLTSNYSYPLTASAGGDDERGIFKSN